MPWSYLLSFPPVTPPNVSGGSSEPVDGPIRDLLLDDDGDLFIGDGDLGLASGGVAAKQGAAIRLKCYQGDWFLDTDEGIPYFQRVLIKNPNMSEVREWFRLAIADTPDIDTVYRVVFGLNKTRQLQVFWQAATTSGAAILNAQGVTIQ